MRRPLSPWVQETMTEPTRVRSHGRALNRGHLTDDDVRKIRRAFEYGATLATVAEQFKISVPNAWSIRTRRTWKHIP